MDANETQRLPYNPAVLAWARTRAGLLEDEVAERVHVDVAKLHSWEAGSTAPTVRQGRSLAKIYGRPFLEFFSRSVPEIPDVDLVPDFRMYTGKTSADDVFQLKEIQRWAEEQRTNTLALFDEIGEQPPILSSNLKFSVSDDAENAAAIAREALSFPVEEQLALRSDKASSFPNILRDHIESMGILVLKETKLSQYRARGICLFASPLPVIVFASEAPSAQAFTLAHEFGHVLLGQSGISGNNGEDIANKSAAKEVENWCNRFSASLLIPRRALSAYFTKPNAEQQSIPRETLKFLAEKFKVSQHAMLLRLVSLGYVQESFYWRVMRPVFLQEEANYKPFGRSPYYGKRYVNRLGRLYTGLVLDAWGSGAITSHNAAEYMGIDNLTHLVDIRGDFAA
jgi:Zn-dependent peptidase ImmA (M78 family)/DNA-binding XRE family transcriptional regulator